MSEQKASNRIYEWFHGHETAMPDDSSMLVQQSEIDWVLKEVTALEARLETREDALRQIAQWADAYPLDIFPEPDFQRASALLMAGGITLDAISASNMRYVVREVGLIAKTALAAQQEGR